MAKDFWQLSLFLSFGFVVGLQMNTPFLGALMGSLLFIYFYSQRMSKLCSWLNNQVGTEQPPYHGLIGAISKEFSDIRRHYKQRGEKLTGYLNRFQDATDALPDAIIILAEHGRIDWANKKACEYLDIRWPQDSGQRISNLIRKPEMARFIHSMNEGHMDHTLELEFSSPRAVRLEFRIAPYGEEQKLMLARNITKLHQNKQMRKDFIANASHELRTPLTVISGYLEVFNDDTDCPSSWQPMIKTMRSQASRMQSLLSDLLQLSALESNSGEVAQTDEILVSEMVSSIHQEAASVSGAMGHVFYIEAEPALRLRGNQGQLYSAFSNLVINAVHYTPKRGIIRIKWFMQGDEACFQVSDTGDGIPEADLPRVTERFYRVDKGRSREQGGTGLGLAIVKHVLAVHNAHLTIESTLGEGSTFTCHFNAESVLRKDTVSALNVME